MRYLNERRKVMEKYSSKNGVGVFAYKGDAMTLLAFDLDASLTKNFVGFSIRVTAGNRKFYLNNKLFFKPAILKKNNIDADKKLSTLYSPIQKYRWVHVPSSEHYVDNPYFGEYTYEVTPRYIKEGILEEIDPKLTVSVTIDLSPFKNGDTQLGFTRAFVSSQAYAYHFANNSKLRPNKTDLIFDIKQVSGSANRWDNKTKKYKKTDYTFEEQHEYLGWQARDRIMEFLDEIVKDKKLTADIFAYDLNEPVVAEKIIKLAKEGRVRIILDNAGSHKETTSMEYRFDKLFKEEAKDKKALYRGKYLSLAHSKVFIQKKNGKAVKVLTGSTNFTTNGMYINANHVIVFNNPEAAQIYADVFDASFGDKKMSGFKKSAIAAKEYTFKQNSLPDMTIRFSPHPAAVVNNFFKIIVDKINNAQSDVLFAIMKDNSKSSILDSVRKQVKSDKIFTFGITDETSGILLYKPDSKRGVKVSGRGTETNLPPPFNDVADIPGHNIHHKFILIDFKGDNPVLFCGSSNLAYKPEQSNGDNLIEIRNSDIVTAFAVEAIRLVDHFQWRNKKFTAKEKEEPLQLHDPSEKKQWYKAYYNPKDLLYLERTLLMK